jgi:hypothetical protein
LLKTNPITTSVVSSGLAWAVGDLLSQYKEKKMHYDWKRCKIFFTWGVLSAPMIFFPYVLAPIYLYQFYPAIGYLEGKTHEESLEERKAKLSTTFSLTFKCMLASGFLGNVFLCNLCAGLIYLYYARGMSFIAHGKMEQ